MYLAQLQLDDLKAQARRLRAEMTATGNPMSHSRALELVARSHGARDWNTLAALARRGDTRPPAHIAVGARVSGEYLGQRFSGTVRSLKKLADSHLYQVTFHFDEPVDVVTFESFSAFRQRVSGTIDELGISPTRTSNGCPHIMLDR